MVLLFGGARFFTIGRDGPDLPPSAALGMPEVPVPGYPGEGEPGEEMGVGPAPQRQRRQRKTDEPGSPHQG